HRHPLARRRRGPRVLPLTARTVRCGRGPERRVLRRRGRGTLARPVGVLQADGSARRGVRAPESAVAMIVSGVQHDTVWEDPEANFAHLGSMIAKAAAGGARLVVLTEMFSTGFSMNTERTAEPPDGKSAQFLIGQAREHDVVMCASLPERATPDALP